MAVFAFKTSPSGGRKPKAVFKLLTRVTLAVPVTSDGRELPAGSVGTVVHEYRGGKAFEVEFSKPFHTVATVEIAQLIGQID